MVLICKKNFFGSEYLVYDNRGLVGSEQESWAFKLTNACDYDELSIIASDNGQSI